MSGPLTGVRILDLTTVLFGPFATQIMGDLGADVIKIESPGGDVTRQIGPRHSDDMAAVFMNSNRNKRSVVLDLKTEEARGVLREMAGQADIFIHNIRPQKMKAMGLDQESLRAVAPQLIYCGLHGYQEDGPYGGRPAYDDVIQGEAGFVDVMERHTGDARFLPTVAADKVSGLTAAYAVIAALYEREKTGKGQFVEVPMLESCVSFLMNEHMFGAFTGDRDGFGYSRALTPHRRPHRTSDGHICLLAYTDEHWRKFWAIADRPDLASDKRFVSVSDRANNIGELYRLAGGEIAKRTTADWMQTLEDAEIPCGRINRLSDLPDDPHLRGTGFFQTLEHPSEGTFMTTRPPVRFSESPDPSIRPPSRLGADNEEVLREFGIDESRIKPVSGN